MDNYRRQWFIDRIGKRVYRGPVCSCDTCRAIETTGLVIIDKLHADYLCDIEAEYNADGHPVRYVDSLEEVATAHE